MHSLTRRQSWALTAVGAIIVAVNIYSFLGAERALAVEPGLPLDDGYIHQVFARNLAHGHGFSFNPGEPSAGSTAPLWTFFLAAGYLLTGDYLLVAKLLGVLFWLLALVLLYKIASHLLKSALLTAAFSLLNLLTGRFYWGALSGMEIALYQCLFAAAFYLLIRFHELRRSAQTVLFIVLGLSVWVRPEAMLISALFVFLLIFDSSGWSRRSLPSRVAALGPGLALLAFLIGAYFLFNASLQGRPLPNAYYSKAWISGLTHGLARGDFAEVLRSVVYYPWLKLYEFFAYFLTSVNLHVGRDFNPLLAVLIVLALPLSIADSRINRRASSALSTLALMVAIVALLGVFSPQTLMDFHNSRYFVFLHPFVYLLAMLALKLGADLLNLNRRKYLRNALLLTLSGTAVLLQVRTLPVQARHYATSVQNINALQKASGQWLRAHTQADDKVAVNDVGAIGFFGERYLVDLLGLVTPEINPYKQQHVLDYIRQHRLFFELITPAFDQLGNQVTQFAWVRKQQARYLIVFPIWFNLENPNAVWRDGERRRLMVPLGYDSEEYHGMWFHPVDSFTVAVTTVCPGTKMVIYSIDGWARSSNTP